MNPLGRTAAGGNRLERKQGSNCGSTSSKQLKGKKGGRHFRDPVGKEGELIRIESVA